MVLNYGSVPHVPGFLNNELSIKNTDLSCKPKHKVFSLWMPTGFHIFRCSDLCALVFQKIITASTRVSFMSVLPFNPDVCEYIHSRVLQYLH